RDDLVMPVEPGMDLPLVGGADPREGRSSRRGSEADEAEGVANGEDVVSGEIEDLVPIGLACRKPERVVSTAASNLVLPALAIGPVVVVIAGQRVVEVVARAVVGVPVVQQRQIFDIGA